MNNLTTERHELNRQIELGQAVQRLENSKDFQQVVLEGYINNVLLNESQKINDDEDQRKEVTEMIQSAIRLRTYLQNVKEDAVSAVNELNEGELYE